MMTAPVSRMTYENSLLDHGLMGLSGAAEEYASSPTPFWLVKLMDLGIVVPVALATGVGLLRGAAWANRTAYVVLTGYTCLAVSVATMGLIMYANGDPDASLPLTAGFVGFAAVLTVLTVMLYRPLVVPPDDREHAAPTGRPAVG